MPSRSLRLLATIVATVAVAAACGGDDGGGPTDAAAPVPRDLPTSSCLWSAPVTVDSNNTQYPDAGVAYWFTSLRIPAGATLRLTGEYPHSRYASFNSYGPDPANGEQGLPLDALADVEIAPESRSTNPFEAGADRTVADRTYTVQVVGEEVPDGDGAPNTLYARSPGASGATTETQLIYRVYVPDRGTEPLGGVALPRPEVVAADGTTSSGDQACAALDADGELPATLPAVDVEQYRSLVALGDPATHPALDPPRWTRFFNARQALLSSFWAGTPQEGQIAALDATEAGGYYSNAHTDYVVAPVNRLLGPAPGGANVLVVTGRAPVTPRTVEGEETTGAGQVRYWSLCQNESPVTTRVSGCLYDEQVPVDADGRYTIVISTPEDRPASAIEACGVAWLAWGAGDGVSRPEAGTLLLRHLFPAPDFGATIDAVPAPGAEAATMGDYLPDLRYAAADGLEVGDCP